MTTNLAKWASNNGQIIKSGLSDDRRAKFLPSVVGVVYDWLRYECHLGNVGLKMSPGQTGGSKEVWVSPRFEARMKAQSEANLRDGETRTREQFANAYQERKAQARRK